MVIRVLYDTNTSNDRNVFNGITVYSGISVTSYVNAINVTSDVLFIHVVNAID